MIDSQALPQQWGAHLNKHASVIPLKELPPVGCHSLPFESMHAEQFEQFCWWLLCKEQDLQGCHRLGGSGQAQGGIDIFAYDPNDPSRLLVFECKCWHSYKPNELKSAVGRFLSGQWASRTSTFTLIIAQKTIGNLAQSWEQARGELRARGIEGELWTGEDLTRKLQTAPDVLTKFFSAPDTQQFSNEWMRRVGLLDLLSKALVDPRKEVSEPAYEFISHGLAQRESLETRSSSDGVWSIQQPWLDVSAMLPTPWIYPGSATITIKMRDTAGVVIALDQSWLLKKYLGNSGEPILSTVRPFFQGVVEEGGNHVVDLKNCRFLLPKEAVVELASVADELSESYLFALCRLEEQWGANGFPFLARDNVRVVLCVVESWIWEILLEFTQEHDEAKGKSEWHIFHSSPNHLMPHASEGYHGIFSAEKVERFCDEDQVAILWQPSLTHQSMESSVWWDCSVAFEWITGQLFPAVGRWRARNVKVSLVGLLKRGRKRRRVIEFWAGEEVFKDVHNTPLLETGDHRRLGLVKTLQALQSFYHGGSRCGRAYFRPHELAGLYDAMYLLLGGGRGHPNYIASKLGVQPHGESYSDLSNAVLNLINSNHYPKNTYAIECVMRGMLEALDDDEEWLSSEQKAKIFTWLEPYMRFYDHQMLIDRHTS